MSAEPKLPRWTEPGADAPSELAELLRAGRAPLGTPEEVARLGQGLGQLLGHGAAGLSATSLAAPAASAGLGLVRWAAWAAAGVSGAAALWYFSADSAPPAPPAPAPVVLSQPAPVLAPEPAPAPVEPAPEVEPPAKPPVSEAKPSRPTARTPAASTPAASNEVELLRRAQAALAAQPARALALTSEHQRLFRSGALAEEREALAIEALRRLGRTQEAQRRTAQFLRRYPNSVHASRVRGTAAPAGR